MQREITVEATVIQGLLTNPTRALDTIGRLSRECFTDEVYGTLYDAAYIVLSAGKNLNTITIQRALQACKANRATIQDAVAATMDMVEPVAILKLEAATERLNAIKEAREVISDAQAMILAAKDHPETAKEVQANRAMRALDRTDSEGVMHVSDVVGSTIDQIEEAMTAHREGRLPEGSVSTGITHLDVTIGGVRKGNILLIGAPTGGGKSTLTRQILMNAAQAGHPCMYCYLEMDAEEITTSLACLIAGVDTHLADTGKITYHPEDYKRVMDGLAQLQELPIYLYKGFDTDTILSKFYQWRLSLPKDCPTPLFGFDYIGLDQNYIKGTKEEKIADTAMRLNHAASQYGVGVILCTQLNEEHKKRADKRPALGDCRYSKAPEHFAKCVVYLHYPAGSPETLEDLQGNPYPETYREALVVKGRRGGVGIVSLKADMATGRIVQMKIDEIRAELARPHGSIQPQSMVGGKYAF